jgi:hypothetical protein
MKKESDPFYSDKNMKRLKGSIADLNADQNTPQRLEYGAVQEYGNGTTLWFEPITDTLDGFVLRRSDNGSILAVFSQDS